MSIYTRFPPEPNGYIHLGHLKAMLFDFDKHPDSKCYLRFDDTNPETERKEYVDAIIDDVTWLGFTPWKITYTSDYFDKLYEFAIDLIKNGKAYVDISPPGTISTMRHDGIESPYRNMTTEFNLSAFDDMKNGKYGENDAVLRLKIDMTNNNHTLRDPIAYRIKYVPHYRTDTTWCIYPTYDYSHGIVDALENIKYSYCTMEFFIRREQYYWPIHELIKLGHNLTPAEVTEFGRLNVTNNILSKRKIIDLIKEDKISGFDDPRLLTIRGLRRRGFPPELLRKIVSDTTTIARAETEISEHLINHYLRNFYDAEAIRVFGVLNPLKVIIDDPIDGIVESIHPNHPKNDMGSHIAILTNTFYIDSSDFRNVDDPSYYRLAPEKTIRLKYSDFYSFKSFTDDPSEKIVRVVRSTPDNPKKIRGIIHWVNEHAVDCIFEEYESLMTCGTFNNLSKRIHRGKIEAYALEIKDKPLQLERIGYFKFDRYDEEIPVFIRIIDFVDKYNK